MGLRTDATLLDVRLKAAKLPVETVYFDGDTPVVQLARSATDEQKAALAQLLATHTEDAALAAQEALKDERPMSRREVRALIQQMIDKDKEKTNAK